MYNSHPSDGTYGSPGFFVANPSGKVRDPSGKLVDLRPDELERQARRILVRTSELQKKNDGSYVAKIRKAKNVSAIKLTYASIPRSVSRVTAQLVLYSIPIKKNLTSVDHQKLALQRMCRSQLLSPDTSDVPFFRMSNNDFDWRSENSTSAWINSFDRNTFIPPQLESEISNQYVDIDVLTVKVPSMCSLNSLGMAFANALKSHSGAQNIRNNSIWSNFDISVEETGFSVFENINDADVFTTFAAVAPPYVTADDSSLIRQNQSAVDSFIPMGTPLTIRMNKSRSVFVSTDTLTGASTSPAYISPSFSNMTEFSPSSSSGGSDLTSFETVIDTSSRFVHSFSCIGDVSEDDILEVEYRQVVELHVTTVPTSSVDPIFSVRYYYGEAPVSSTELTLFLRTNNNSIIEFEATTGTGVSGPLNTSTQTIQIKNASFNNTTGVLTKTGGTGSAVVRMGSSFFHHSSTNSTVTVSEVKRTYQKTRDVRLGLKWGNNKEHEDFFIDTNHIHDSPVITNDPNIKNINPNYDFVGQQRRDVALLTQYSKKVTALLVSAINNSDTLSLYEFQPSHSTIIPGMVVTADGIEETVTEVITNQVKLSNPITAASETVFTFQVSPVNNSTYHNLLRNIGDLEDTYIDPTTTSSEIYNVHQVNDAHQIQKMLFTGHMMNVTEPSPMPVANPNIFPSHTTGLRPPVVTGSPTAFANDFYVKGLGWQTSIVHAETRFIMPAFPCRFTEINDYSNSGNPPSIYSTTSTPVETSVSPLVSRILNPTNVVPANAPAGTAAADMGYYQLNKVTESGTVVPDFVESKNVNDLSCYTPRSSNTCGIVVTIGNENYVIKKAHLVSVLRNETMYTLNLTCDRNYLSSPVVLSSIKNLESIRDSLKKKGYNTEKERIELDKRLESIETEIQSAFHSFYEKLAIDNGYQVDANAKYFSWVYELDRPVKLPTGISAATHNPYRPVDASTCNPPVTDRTFNGIADNAALFTPGVYERNTGRCAVTNIQECAHSFSVRSGSQESENSLLVLHGIGSLERPVNSTHSTDTGDVFAVMGADNDLKKPEKMACDATTYLRSPENLDSLTFHFMNSRTGEVVDIGNQNATLIFDIYCSNE